MKGVTQSQPHIYDVWDHSLHTVQALEQILTVLDKDYEHGNEEGGDLFTGLLSSFLGRYREQIAPGCAIFADLRVKHASPLVERPLAEEAQEQQVQKA